MQARQTTLWCLLIWMLTTFHLMFPLLLFQCLRQGCPICTLLIWYFRVNYLVIPVSGKSRRLTAFAEYINCSVGEWFFSFSSLLPFWKQPLSTLFPPTSAQWIYFNCNRKDKQQRKYSAAIIYISPWILHFNDKKIEIINKHS